MSYGNNVGAINEQYQYIRLTASGVIKGLPGILGGFIVASGSPTILIYDNATTNSGTIILNTMQTTAGTPYPLPVRLTNGAYAVIVGTGDITFFTANG